MARRLTRRGRAHKAASQRSSAVGDADSTNGPVDSDRDEGSGTARETTPVSFDVLQQQLLLEARRQPRRLGRLPSLILSAFGLVWRTNPWATAATVVAQVAGAAIVAIQVLVGGLLIRELVSGDLEGVETSLLVPTILLVVVTAIGGLATAAGTQVGRLLGMQVERQVTNEVLEVSTRVDLVTYDDPTFYDQLSRVLSTMPTQPYQVVTSLASVTGGVAGVVALVCALIGQSPFLALILLAAGVPLWLLSRKGGALEFDFALAQASNVRERDYLVGLLTRREGAAEARAYLTSPFLRTRFDMLFGAYLSQARGLIRKRYALAALSGLATSLASVGALVALYVLIRRGAIDIAQAASVVIAIRLLAGRLSLLLAGLSTLFQSALFLDDFRAFGDRSPPAKAASTARPPTAMTVDLDDVSFSYPNSKSPALSSISLRIPAGQMVALVGENGSGKSTLAKVVAGLYAPSEGSVRWSTLEGEAIPTAAARAATTLVLQDFARYQLSARDNIVLGRPEDTPDDPRAQAAAQRAGIHDLLAALSDGYDTRLSRQFAGGRELSGGQWQRVALARAYYRDASFIILDEPAASLDPRAEHQLYESVRALFAGQTVVFITHRLRGIRNFDRILVLEHGRVVQDGTHVGLASQPGVYADLIGFQDEVATPSHVNDL